MMEDHEQFNFNTPYDPAANYSPCCHPSIMPVGTVARDSYDAWQHEQSVMNEAQAQAQRDAAQAFNNDQEHNRGD